MKPISIPRLLLLTIVSLGVYAIVWAVRTKDELNRRGADVPTAWLLLVPGANVWWGWRFCGGVELATRGRLSQALTFLLFVVLGLFTIRIVQDAFNKQASLAPVGG